MRYPPPCVTLFPSSSTSTYTPGIAKHADPGFVVVTPGSDNHVASCLCLPPCINYRGRDPPIFRDTTSMLQDLLAHRQFQEHEGYQIMPDLLTPPFHKGSKAVGAV